MMKLCSFVITSIAVSAFTVHAASVANFSAVANDRFANNPAFIASAYDLSGVGRTSNGRWATRIGPNYYLSANHFRPANGDTVTFFTTNDPSGPTYSYQSAGGFAIPSSDLWLGYFKHTLHSSIATYEYNTTSANSLTDAGINLADLFMLGNSPTGNLVYGGPGALTDMVVAQNRAESWFEKGTNTVLAAGETNSFVDINNNPANANWDAIVTFRNLSGDTAYAQQTYEGQLQGGDSGSPLFSVVGGELRVEGIAWAVVTSSGGFSGNFIDTAGEPGSIEDPFERREGSLYTYTGSLSSALTTAIGNVPAPIPEPSQLVLLFLASGLMLRRKRY